MITVIIILFIAFNLILIKQKFNPDRNYKNCDIKISVIVAAKNERDNLTSLVNSLSRLNYDDDNYEVIIIDDNSTDKTYDLAISLTKNKSNFTVLKTQSGQYEGKRAALQTGLNNANYPFVVVTDADCVHEKNFLSAYCDKFSQGNDFIFGISPIRQNETVINKIACFDNLRVHILTFGFASYGLPYSCAARSLGFSLNSFKKVGGYDNASQTLSGDDDLLLNQFVKNKLRISTITDKSAFVFTKAKSSLEEFINQKSRHTSTANYYPAKIKLLLGLWHGLNLFMLISPILAWLDIYFLFIPFVKIIGDIIAVTFLMKKFGYKFNPIEIIYLQIIYELLLMVNYFRGTFGKRKW